MQITLQLFKGINIRLENLATNLKRQTIEKQLHTNNINALHNYYDCKDVNHLHNVAFQHVHKNHVLGVFI